MNQKTNRAALAAKRRTNVLLWIVMLIFGALQFFPLLWVADFSLVKDSEVFASGILTLPNPPQWENYRLAWVNGNILRYSLNSLLVVGITIALTVLLSLMLGYSFVRMRWKGAKWVLSFVLLGMMIPIHTTLLPNFLIFKTFHILDTPLALIIPYAAVSVPFGVFVMTGFLRDVPRALEEAAVMDGAGIFRIVFQIVAPITKPAIVTVIVLTFINNWNEFIVAATYLSSELWKTLPFSVYEFAGQYTSRYAVQFAVMVLSALPALLVYMCLNEQITKGITFGAVKG